MNSIKSLLKENTNLNDYIVEEGNEAFFALKKLTSNKMTALFVCDNKISNNIVGVFTEKDYYENVVNRGNLSLVVTVKDIVNRKIPFVNSDCSVEDCFQLMKDLNLHYMPVIENNKALGIVTKEKIIDSLIEKKEFLINQLTVYITGNNQEYDSQSAKKEKLKVSEMDFSKKENFSLKVNSA